ncbi:hypothetical protein F511_38161 [Dorcoceras hygrometricum]|uniref:Uncharacterized protein n=1 Tax=Dorcoceras hygrometricum TaxID=472368 RepID=A0A2Z7CZH6_9LAMI|nr:hypothetical protein F511_38161 [Dorcoceras hygrometricum]
MHDLISAIDSSILSVDCVEWLNILQQIVQQLFAHMLFILCHNTSRNSRFTFIAIAGKRCSRLVVQTLVLNPAGCPVVGREKLATGFPNDWLDQTMSYQLIQTTSFAIHPRLIEYNAVALVWMYKLPAALQLIYRSSSNLRLFSASVPACPLAPADLSTSAEYDVVTDYIIIDGPLRCSSWFSFDVPAGPSSSSSACSWFISFQLIHSAPAAGLLLISYFITISWFTVHIVFHNHQLVTVACDWFCCCLRLIPSPKYLTTDSNPASGFLSTADCPYPTTGCS